MTVVPDSRIANALDLLRKDARRTVYEAAPAGSGNFYVTYGAGDGSLLTRDDVRLMVERGWLVEDPKCVHLFNRGNLP